VPPRSVVLAQIEPDYFQFYARRAGAAWASDPATDAGYEAHLWSNGGFVMIGTARKFGTTEVGVEVWDTAPDQPDEQWQHVAEVSLEPGGSLEILAGEPKLRPSLARAQEGTQETHPVNTRAGWDKGRDERWPASGVKAHTPAALRRGLWSGFEAPGTRQLCSIFEAGRRPLSPTPGATSTYTLAPDLDLPACVPGCREERCR
jgi:hypothetical protein